MDSLAASRERSVAEMAKACPKCARKQGDHKLSELLFCLYEGTPLKAGGRFGQDAAREIVRAVKDAFDGLAEAMKQ